MRGGLCVCVRVCVRACTRVQHTPMALLIYCPTYIIQDYDFSALTLSLRAFLQTRAPIKF